MKANCDICTAKDVILPKNSKGKILYCTCPLCNMKVGAEIYEGKIKCPSCGQEEKWDEA